MIMMRLLLAFLATLPFSSSLQGGVWSRVVDTFQGSSKSTPPTIRVLVVHDAEGVQLEVKGKYSLYDPHADSYISSRFIGKNRYMQALSDGLKWGEAFPGLYQLKIHPDESHAVMVVDSQTFAGDLYIYDVGGTISIVNQIPVEDYVRAVLMEYQGQQLHPETWAALAIVARTNAYFQTVHPKTSYWAVDAQKVGFKGLAYTSQQIEEAVRLTRYMIMSQTGIYEGTATPFAAQWNGKALGGQAGKEVENAQISLEEANQLAEKGAHAAQILGKAFPHTTIMLMEYAN